MAENHCQLTPKQWRQFFRQGKTVTSTAALCPGFVQANLTVLPELLADDFEEYCQLNPKACPLLQRLSTGSWEPSLLAGKADIRTDIPLYRVYQSLEGCIQFHECCSVVEHWSADSVAFLTGCSFSFDHLLLKAGIIPRHIELSSNVSMFQTCLDTVACGAFSGPLVVSMRAVKAGQVDAVIQLTEQYPEAHGAPLNGVSHIELGIESLTKPDWGSAVEIRKGEVPLFWPCGVTTQLAVMNALRSYPDIRAICHAPGHMFISDRRLY